MKTQIEDISQVKKKLLIEIEADNIDARINKAFKELGKRAKIKGFRQGKIPPQILERYYGDQVISDVTSDIIQETLPAAIEETGIYPLSMPVIENELLKRGQDYKYAAVMEIRPEFELTDYLGAEVEKGKCEVNEEDVEKQIAEIRESHGTLESISDDRPLKDGDYAIIDYEGFEGDNPVKDLKSENFPLQIGGERFFPGVEKALIGAKKGDSKEVGVDFEGDYFNSRLAGKSILFRITITDIKELKLPELNDEFAKGLGPEIENLDQLRVKIRESLESREEKRIDKEVKDSLLDKIAESVEFELPETLVQGEINASLENINQNLMRAGSSFEKSGLDEAKMREEIRPAAEKNVKRAMILGEIASRNNIEISDEELTKGYEELAKGFGTDAETMRRYYENSNMSGNLRHTLLKEKTLNYLLENANVVEINANKKRD